MDLVVTEEEARRREAICKRRIENARTAWQHHDTKENRDAYYEALRDDLIEYLHCRGIGPVGNHG